MEALLNKLNQHTGEFNVSLIIPIENELFDRQVNRNRVKAAIKEAGEKVLQRRSDYQFLIDKMYGLFAEINWEHPRQGIGIFVSPAIAEWVNFSNPVTEKIIAGESFETRDIVFEITQTRKFWLLTISRNLIRLFHCEGKEAKQITNEIFPMKYSEQFEFDKTPSRIRSTHGVEDSRSKEIRDKDFLRAADHHLTSYMKEEKLPVIVGGVERVIDMFDEVTKNAPSIAGRMHGNFDHSTAEEIVSAGWNVMISSQKMEQEKIIHLMEEAIGTCKCALGVKEVWNAAVAGRCDTLVVEKDYMMPAIFDSELFRINLNGKMINLSPRMDDVVNNIINVVREKKGKIFFAGNDELPKFGKIASLLRY